MHREIEPKNYTVYNIDGIPISQHGTEAQGREWVQNKVEAFRQRAIPCPGMKLCFHGFGITGMDLTILEIPNVPIPDPPESDENEKQDYSS